ncbi:MAG: DUF3800 domain-containing protein [Magnetococcales bacterium]|nr:DUF3800 domain-containing protein [Magnetococcales bacterium]
MDFDVYCDESRPDLLTSRNSTGRFMVIGSLWLESFRRKGAKSDIHALRDLHRIGGEFKWQKVSPSKIQFYLSLLDWFFAQAESAKFKCILVSHDPNDLEFHEGDGELGFYKYYFEMLHPGIVDPNRYSIFCDYKSNRLMTRLQTLRGCLSAGYSTSPVVQVQAVRSEESVLIQLTDLLTGAVSARLNDSLVQGSAKTVLVSHLESRLGRPLLPENRGGSKFDILEFRRAGGS